MKHSAKIHKEFMKHATTLGDGKFMGINQLKDAHPMMGDPGYAQWFTTELKRRIDENHANDAVEPKVFHDHEKDYTSPNNPLDRTFSLEITVESPKMPQFLNCGQDCPYLEYQGNPKGEYRGTPWCNLFKKDLGYPRSYDGVNHPLRSPECVSATEGLI